MSNINFEKLDKATFSKAHIQAILVAGSGFFVDSYDNFVIGLIVPMLAYGYYNQSTLDPISDGWLKAASSWGNMIGQFSFAIMGDLFGRKKIYGVELVILIAGALGCAIAAWPTGQLSIVASLAIWRFILGVGIGGDYPVSAVITSEFASTRRRGQMIATVFAMQGLGIICGAVVSIAVLACFKPLIEKDHTYLNYCWRILAGFGIVPAALAVYFRLTIPETPRFTVNVLKDKERGDIATELFLNRDIATIESVNKKDAPKKTSNKNIFKSYREAFSTYFSKWAHLKVLLGCALTWFFLDIGYYGTSLNTATVLGFIGYGAPTGNYFNNNTKIYDDIWNRSVGQAIINLAGTVPGYWFTVAFIDMWGRKPIQYMGFIMLTLIFLFLTIFFPQLSDAHTSHNFIGFIILYAFAQFFFNFGPNATTFVIPAECFPTAVRSTGHGISAATGKAGAIIAAQGFSVVAKSSIGVQGVLAIFTVCMFLGLCFSWWVPETKGLSLEELNEEYEKDVKKEDIENKNSSKEKETSSVEEKDSRSSEKDRETSISVVEDASRD